MLEHRRQFPGNIRIDLTEPVGKRIARLLSYANLCRMIAPGGTAVNDPRSRVPVLVSVSLLIGSVVLFFVPVTIYSGNLDEFDVSLPVILAFFGPLGIVLTLLLTTVGMVLSKQAFQRYVSFLFALGLLLWVQGNLLVWQYGLLDGSEIDWRRGDWRGYFDSGVWLSLLVVAVVFRKRISHIALFGSAAVVGVNAAALVFLTTQSPEIWTAKRSGVVPEARPSDIFGFSSEDNVLQIVLDGFQSDLFGEIIREDPERWFEVLDGFTFFEEAMGVFPTTRMSVPAMMSGKVYENDVPMSDFITDMSMGQTISNALFDARYDVHIVPDNNWYYRKGRYSAYYHIRVPYDDSANRHELSTAAKILDLVGFRVAPHFLKSVVFADGKWRIRRMFEQSPGSNIPSMSNRSFLRDFIDTCTVDRKRRTFKYIHLMTTHGPPVLTTTCDYAGKRLPSTRANLKIQARCGFEQVMLLLDKLRRLGIYDRCLIVINADHGAGDCVDNDVMLMHEESIGALGGVTAHEFRRMVGSASPLLLVKPPRSAGLLRVSRAQVSLTDIPDTISSMVDLGRRFGGRNVFEVGDDESRERRFNDYRWRHENWQDEFFDRMDRWVVRGSAFDVRSWTRESPAYSPEVFDTRFTVDFGTRDAARYRVSGWGRDEESKSGESFNWAVGKTAKLILPIPSGGTSLLSATISTADFHGPQQIDILLNGRFVGTWTLTTPWKFSRRHVVIDAADRRPDMSTVEFKFSSHWPEDGGRRPVAVAFASISVGELPRSIPDG